MKCWLASADPSTVQRLTSFGLFTGVVTNPDAVARTGRAGPALFRELCQVAPGRVYAMIRESSLTAMQTEAAALLEVDAARIGLKVAPTPHGLQLIHWLHSQRVSDLMLTGIATTGHLALAVGVGARWVTPWGSLPQKFGGPSREVVLEQMQSCLEKLRAPTELIVGASTADDIGKLALYGIRHCFIWDRDVPGVVECEWIRRALATFEPAWTQMDASTGTVSADRSHY